MWKRDAGNWQERLQRGSRTAPPGPPAAPSPPEVRPRFLAGGFEDRDPGLELPVPAAAAVTHDLPPDTWVTFSGVDGSNALNLRESLEASVGHTAAHYVPQQGDGKLVYVRFERAEDAHWVVRRGRLQLDWYAGTASSAEEMEEYYAVEVDASWCTDGPFLAHYGMLGSTEDPGLPDDVLTSGADAYAGARGSLDARGLFYTPCDGVLYQLLRLVVLLIWGAGCGVGLLLGWRPDLRRLGRNGWREGWAGGSVASSPPQYLCYWLAWHLPIVPSVADVDLLLWSWWSAGCAQPQRALRHLEQRLRLNRTLSTEQHTLEGKDGSLPALLTWRASPWYTQYKWLASLGYALLLVWALWG